MTAAGGLTPEHARTLVATTGSIDKAAAMGSFPVQKFREFCRAHGVMGRRRVSTDGRRAITPEEYIEDQSDLLVYFIRAESSQIKIGISYDPVGRLHDLRGASPVPLKLLGTIPGGIEQEIALHKRFAKQRLHGEWFAPEIRFEVAEILDSETKS